MDHNKTPGNAWVYRNTLDKYLFVLTYIVSSFFLLIQVHLLNKELLKWSVKRPSFIFIQFTFDIILVNINKKHRFLFVSVIKLFLCSPCFNVEKLQTNAFHLYQNLIYWTFTITKLKMVKSYRNVETTMSKKISCSMKNVLE